MIVEVAALYAATTDKFLLLGFSGGGHFTHRFFDLHPERLLGVSIGAPGRITYLDNSKIWYNGIGDFEEQFGKSVEIEKLIRVPVHLVIGAEDLDSKFTNDRNDSSRLESSDAHAHEGFKVLDHVRHFFLDILESR